VCDVIRSDTIQFALNMDM